jgi:hypothetical protein
MQFASSIRLAFRFSNREPAIPKVNAKINANNPNNEDRMPELSESVFVFFTPTRYPMLIASSMAKNKKITTYFASKSNKKECFIGFQRIDYFFDNEGQKAFLSYRSGWEIFNKK